MWDIERDYIWTAESLKEADSGVEAASFLAERLLTGSRKGGRANIRPEIRFVRLHTMRQVRWGMPPIPEVSS